MQNAKSQPLIKTPNEREFWISRLYPWATRWSEFHLQSDCCLLSVTGASTLLSDPSTSSTSCSGTFFIQYFASFKEEKGLHLQCAFNFGNNLPIYEVLFYTHKIIYSYQITIIKFIKTTKIFNLCKQTHTYKQFSTYRYKYRYRVLESNGIYVYWMNGGFHGFVDTGL